MNYPEWINAIKWGGDGLVPAVAQDYQTGTLLTQAWMNREALEKTLQLSRAVYWSRSRQQLWVKGEVSGHVQEVSEIRTDCDRDTILLLVKQVGGIACHTGRYSCFFNRLENGLWVEVEPIIRDPEQIYGQHE
jgi:phosphoribosyl-AMP cyclohydrolase